MIVTQRYGKNEKYCESDQINRDETDRVRGVHRGNRISNRGVMRIPEVKRLLGRLGLRWDDNIKMGLKEIEWEGVDWIVLAQKRNQLLGV